MADDREALAIAAARAEVAVSMDPLTRLASSGYRVLATSDLAAIVSAINGTVHALLNHIHGVEQPPVDEEPPAPPVDEEPPAPPPPAPPPPAPPPPAPPPTEREELF